MKTATSDHRRGMALPALCFALLAAAPAGAVDDLSLNVAPGSETVLPGGVVTVTLEVSNLSAPINGVQVLFSYDTTLFTLESVVPTDLGLMTPSVGWVEVKISDVAGDVIYAIAINGDQRMNDHTVATMSFRALTTGVTNVAFRPDASPFFTKLTVASDNTTIFPITLDSGLITITCEDGLFCNGSELFVGGFCQAGTDPCNDGIACTDDTCDEALDTCSNITNDANCVDDGLFCSGTEVCDALLDCVSTGDPCLVDQFCNETNLTCDECVVGTDCDDGVGCTDETCVNGACVSTANDTNCDDGVFCNGAEPCDAALDCQLATDPCPPLICDEGLRACLSPVHVVALELFHAGRFLVCRGGVDDGTACSLGTDCSSGICAEQADPTVDFLATGGVASFMNMSNADAGITGVRIVFDQLVTFATTPEAAFLFDWTTGTGTSFTPVTGVATDITVTATIENGVTVVSIVLTNNHLRRRWLRVEMDASQISTGGALLDGELSGNPAALPSGDGNPGGSAIFYVGSMTGDIDGDRKTSLTDVGQIRSMANPFLPVPIDNVFDVDKDGKVLLTDVGKVRLDVNPFFALPLIVP